MIALMSGSDYDWEKNPVISRVDEHGNFMGGVFYSDYTGASIRVHMAGVTPRWASPDLLWSGFDYPFTQLGVQMILVTVLSTNERALNIVRRLGFRELFRIRDAVRDGDLVLLSMSRAECKYLRMRPRVAAREAA